MKKFKELTESFGRFLSILGTMSLLFIMMYIVISVFSRSITGKPLLGTFELGSTFLPLIAAFYYVNTEIHDRHIRATIIYDRFGPKIRKFLDSSYAFITGIIFIMVSWRVALFGMRNYQMHDETNVLGLPTAPFLFIYSILLLNFAVFMFVKGIEHSGWIPSAEADDTEKAG